jgi:hypothetical protein
MGAIGFGMPLVMDEATPQMASFSVQSGLQSIRHDFNEPKSMKTDAEKVPLTS